MFTILLQGKITIESFDFYKNHYTDYPILVSTWDGTRDNLEINELPHNIRWIESIDPNTNEHQNFLRQITSTLNGLKFIETQYVIKVRGDEYYSNLQSIINSQVEHENKLIVLPIFFREWEWGTNKFKYHLSDHLMCSNTEVLKKTFELSLEIYPQMTNLCASESILGESYCKARNNNTASKELFKNSIFIHPLNTLEPYKIVFNGANKLFYNNFAPKEQDSIENINNL